MLRVAWWLIVAVVEFLLLETGLVGVRNSVIGQIEYLDTLDDTTLRIAALVLALIVALLAIGPTRLGQLRGAFAAREPEVGERRRGEEPDTNVGDRSQYMSNSPGGQQAFGDIINQGPRPRDISPEAGKELAGELRKHKPVKFQISSMQDAESSELGAMLRGVLERGGWQMTMEISGAMLSGDRHAALS